MSEKSKNTEQLSEEEKGALKQAIQQAVLGADGLDKELEQNPEAYLRLVNRADLAVTESSLLLADAVNQAKRMGHPWAVIGKALGISRQATQQRFGQPGFDPEMNGTRRTIGQATAFNEMEILKYEGEAGNHLVDFGPLFLIVEASDQQWEHMRVTLVWMGDVRRQLEQAGWVYVGTWFPFRYFKRPKGIATGGQSPR